MSRFDKWLLTGCLVVYVIRTAGIITLGIIYGGR